MKCIDWQSDQKMPLKWIKFNKTFWISTIMSYYILSVSLAFQFVGTFSVYSFHRHLLFPFLWHLVRSSISQRLPLWGVEKQELTWEFSLFPNWCLLLKMDIVYFLGQKRFVPSYDLQTLCQLYTKKNRKILVVSWLRSETANQLVQPWGSFIFTPGILRAIAKLSRDPLIYIISQSLSNSNNQNFVTVFFLSLVD